MINKKKIVVLGGGIGSLSSIFAITSMPDWQQKYDITLYQLGWRLGGKGASGRNAELGQRIEEHGLHVWFGFYDNAFRTIQQCYAELDRPKDAPLATWDQAFKPHDYTAIQEYHHETWKTWSMIFLPRSGTPGIGGREYTPIRYVQDILYWLWKYLLPHLKLRDCAAFLAIIPHAIQTLSSKSITQLSASEQSSPLIALKSALDELYKVVLDMFERTSDNNDVLRRTYIISILWLTAVRGIISDGIIFNGFDVIDDLEFREWLKKHGAPDSVAYSAPIQSFYDLALAYEQGITEGNPSREGNIAAGTALHSFLLVLFAYKGSLMWKMQASMGDVVFTPLYEVLKARGVKFEFFHKVTDLIPNEQGTAIQQIIINKQVSLKNPDQEYQPLVDVKGLPCWPSEPLYEQLVEGEQVQAGQHNLESHWTAWQDAEPNISLNQGVDFDLVICGIPIAALKLISEQLATKSQSWQNMVDNVKTVRSLAMQTWLTKDLKQLGWQHPSVVLDAYIQPFNTWADMGQTISYEAWSASLEPSDIAYFCGTMP
ncbi:NAD(P)-binding protein, partial [Candidatus Albibeggiatoa sp. nov. BB20]|uniref:NAD(P)-binding protein n=1 Tax=Candidatus Albibeggiatoa sp. nov. BB20 TaxID=3162723 RepID=UPI00336571EB